MAAFDGSASWPAAGHAGAGAEPPDAQAVATTTAHVVSNAIMSARTRREAG
jgi:hypothetical protein